MDEQLDCLVVVSHMDDEALSCGGYIQANVAERLRVGVVAVFDRKYNYGRGPQHQKEQIDAYQKSCATLGAIDAGCWLLEEGEPQAQRYVDVLERLEFLLNVTRPAEVVIHDDQDRNQDHKWLSGACKIALRPWANPWLTRVLMCQSPDGQPKDSNWYVPLSEKQLQVKLSAVECYAREARTGSHPRAPEVLRAWHQLCGSFCNEPYAEPYRLLYAKG